ncbi:uncharacterized protein KD926_010676 [Aspergillus affinis]|uniref:uncharacterized protein n=1 Tax=Aspergillus affinis TaxID=1070780 RepID=UPI0022FEBF9A|nr:uncharacterized protein KD926_010676 [Aspergillus affinis]KAI9038547.1 hypothetical protein KD926_010676 [Aspergillus affinis]
MDWDRPQNKWTTEQRIFSSSFEAQLRQSGYTTDISWRTLRFQWETMRRSGNYLWGSVHLSPFIKDGSGTWYPIIRKIKHIAQRLGIDLVEKDEDDTDTSKYFPQPPKDRGSHGTTTTTTEDVTGPGSQAERENKFNQPTARATDETDQNQEVPILVTAGGKFCLFCFQECNMHPDLQSPADEIPPLLYRWSNVDSQGVNSRRLFQAGLFAEGTDYFHPNEVPQDVFNKHVENHLRIKRSVTPFISTFKMMLAPIHHALRNEEGAIVSIIDRRKLSTPIYYAQSLVKTLDLRFSFYNGVAEYLVWGNIPKSAIICSFKATTLLKIARETPEFEDLLQFDSIASFRSSGKALHRVLGSGPGRLNHETGTILGRFLFQLGVPYENCQTVSYGMYNSWWMKRGGGSLEEFYRGVEEGYYALDQHLTPAPTMASTEDEEIPENEEILGAEEIPEDDDMFEMSEVSGFEPPETPETPQISEACVESPGLPVNCQVSLVLKIPQPSEIFVFSDHFDNFEGPGFPELPEAHQSDDETVTNDDPRTSIDLFSMPSSPVPSPSQSPLPVIRLFNGATKQWIAQQGDDTPPSRLPGSSAHTPISVDSDDEFDVIFSGCKSESSVFGSSPPAALNELSLVPDEKTKPIVTLENDNQIGRRLVATPTPRDRFAADRERVLHFWR